MDPIVPGGLPPEPGSTVLPPTFAATASGISPRVLAVAHRGASVEFRENTLPAFARALDLGADAIELDVRVTRDGIVVVHHNADVPLEEDATTRADIATLDLAALRQVDLGGGARIPTLDEVMELVAGRAEVFVELKRPVNEQPVVQCLARHRGPFALHSFDHDAIARLARSAPEIRRGILFDDPFVEPMTELTVHLARTGARDLWPRFDFVTPAFMDAARAHGTRVIAWTVNSLAAGHALDALGIDGLCSDDIRWIREPRIPPDGVSPAAVPASTLAPPQM